jgi:AcrR family transcriptional regulator
MNPAADAKPRTRNRQATEEALVAAASRVFAERGYENATTKQVAEAAGCSEGLIQRYFKGKDGLLIATLNDARHEASHAAFFERPLCASMLDEARESIAHAAKNLGARADAIRIVLSRVLIDATFRGDFARLAVRPQIAAQMRARFERCVEAGLVDRAIDLDAAVDLLMGINFQLGFMHPLIKQTSAAALRRMREQHAELFARAVAPADKRHAR